MISTSSAQSGESALEPVTPWREQFAEQRKSCRDFLALLDSLLETSSPGSSEERVSF
jgi:hypothetical protein